MSQLTIHHSIQSIIIIIIISVIIAKQQEID